VSRRHRINCSSHGTQKELGSISRRDSVCRRLLQTWGRFNASDRGSRNAADCAFRAGAVERRSVGRGRQIGPDAQGATKSLVLLIAALPDRVATHMDSGAMSRLSALATAATPVDPYAVAGRIEQRRESGDRPCPAPNAQSPERSSSPSIVISGRSPAGWCASDARCCRPHWPSCRSRHRQRTSGRRW
jgi:hypothetical protein